MSTKIGSVVVVLCLELGGCLCDHVGDPVGDHVAIDAGRRQDEVGVDRASEVTAPRGPSVLKDTGPLSAQLAFVRRMSVQSHPYRVPSPDQLEISRRAFTALVDGQILTAAAIFDEIGFEVVHLVNEGEATYLVREKSSVGLRGWGLYAVNLTSRRPLLLEAPHPLNDRYTDRQALNLMTRLGGRAVLLSTAFRCATRRRSECPGYTKACGQKRWRHRYTASDVAHTARSIFHVAHEVLFASDPMLIAVQLHGFQRRPDRPRHLIVSDGTRLPGGPQSISNRLAALIKKRLPARQMVVSCNQYRGARLNLCGTHCVQGRHANGAGDPCRGRANKSSNRFLHLEQSLDARRKGGIVDPLSVELALAELIPEGRGPSPLAPSPRP